MRTFQKSKKEKEREELKRLAELVRGSVDIKAHPEWKTRRDIIKWQREIRADRDFPMRDIKIMSPKRLAKRKRKK